MKKATPNGAAFNGAAFNGAAFNGAAFIIKTMTKKVYQWENELAKVHHRKSKPTEFPYKKIS